MGGVDMRLGMARVSKRTPEFCIALQNETTVDGDVEDGWV